jgi:hypothetical protein
VGAGSGAGTLAPGARDRGGELGAGAGAGAGGGEGVAVDVGVVTGAPKTLARRGWGV